MRTYTATSEPLIVEAPSLDSFFDKVAGISRVPDDAEKWPAHVRSELLRTHPYLSKFDVSIVIDKKDDESGYAMGYAMIRNLTSRNVPASEVEGSKNYVRVPIMIKDRQLEKFKTFELGGGVYPLSKSRVEQSMVDTSIFDGPAEAPKRTKSLANDIFPPYQQRQSFGGTRTVGKGASAGSADELMKAALENLDMVKEAYHVGRAIGHPLSWEQSWLKKFADTPFLEEAKRVIVGDKEAELRSAQMRARHAAEAVAEAHLQVEEAELSAKLAKFKFETEGQEEAQTLSKLSCCRDEGRTWASEFEGTAFYEEALEHEAKEAGMRLQRTLRYEESEGIDNWREKEKAQQSLVAKLAAWKYEQISGKKYQGFDAKVTVETSHGKEAGVVRDAATAGRKFVGDLSGITARRATTAHSKARKAWEAAKAAGEAPGAGYPLRKAWYEAAANASTARNAQTAAVGARDAARSAAAAGAKKVAVPAVAAGAGVAAGRASKKEAASLASLASRGLALKRSATQLAARGRAAASRVPGHLSGRYAREAAEGVKETAKEYPHFAQAMRQRHATAVLKRDASRAIAGTGVAGVTTGAAASRASKKEASMRSIADRVVGDRRVVVATTGPKGKKLRYVSPQVKKELAAKKEAAIPAFLAAGAFRLAGSAVAGKAVNAVIKNPLKAAAGAGAAGGFAAGRMSKRKNPQVPVNVQKAASGFEGMSTEELKETRRGGSPRAAGALGGLAGAAYGHEVGSVLRPRNAAQYAQAKRHYDRVAASSGHHKAISEMQKMFKGKKMPTRPGRLAKHAPAVGAAVGALALGGGLYALSKRNIGKIDKELKKREGQAKEALVQLHFSPGDRIPGMTMAAKVKKWNVAPGIVPTSYMFLRLRGTGYTIGVKPGLAKQLMKEKDPAKLRKMLAGPMMKEYRAVQGGRPSPGHMLLLTGTDKAGYTQVDSLTGPPKGMPKKAGAFERAGAAARAAKGHLSGSTAREAAKSAERAAMRSQIFSHFAPSSQKAQQAAQAAAETSRRAASSAKTRDLARGGTAAAGTLTVGGLAAAARSKSKKQGE